MFLWEPKFLLMKTPARLGEEPPNGLILTYLPLLKALSPNTVLS